MDDKPTPYPPLSSAALDEAYRTGQVRGWAVVKTEDGVKFVERRMSLELYQDMQASWRKYEQG